MMGGQEKICGVVDWGVQPYARACAWQKELARLRRAGEIPDLLVLCHHPPVITLGRSAQRENLLFAQEELERRGVEVHSSDRGGDVTFHGPGQLVGYPILDLTGLKKDVVWYVRSLEETLIRATAEFGLEATRKAAPTGKRPYYTGVWVGEEKLAAIGVHIARWVTSHGFAFNVTTDLGYFDLIVPCGITDKRVTSLQKILESSLSPQAPAWGTPEHRPVAGATGLSAERWMDWVKAGVVKNFGDVFAREMQRIETEKWEAWVGAQQATAP